MAEVVEDHLEDGDEETEDWDWEEVDVLVPCDVRRVTKDKRDEEDLICGRAEDEVGEGVLEGGVDAGAVGDEERENKARRNPWMGNNMRPKKPVKCIGRLNVLGLFVQNAGLAKNP